MDLNSMEGLNEICQPVYRTAMKLLRLQRLCHLDLVFVRHITAAVQSGDRANLDRQEVNRVLGRMLNSVSLEVQGHMRVEAPEVICSLMFTLYDRSHSGFLSSDSLQTALIALSEESLVLKHRALVAVAGAGAGFVSRSGLRCVLQDLSQVPAAVQELSTFGSVETAVRSCFDGVLTQKAGEQHVLSWLQSEPHLLLWLPTLYRLSISQNVSHSVRCHTCKTRPITGLRFRCLKCVNIQVCQSCFLTARTSRKHKTHHPVMEFSTQPTWKESLSSLVHSARHSLSPRRYSQREADRRRILLGVEPGGTLNSDLPTSDPSTLAGSEVSHSFSEKEVSHDASVHRPSCSFSSKALQTDEETPPPQKWAAPALLTEVRNLQRDKWLLEQQLQAWKFTVQSEQSMLEDRCSEVEVTMVTLREQNLNLEGKLTQALNKIEAQHHTVRSQRKACMENMEGEQATPSPDGHTESDDDDDDGGNEEGEEDEVLLRTDSWSEDEQTTTPTMQQDTPQSLDSHYEQEGSADEEFLCRPEVQTYMPEEAVQQQDNICRSEEEVCGTSSPEEQLLEIIEGLKTSRWTERQTFDRKQAELLEAADQVGESIHQLMDAMRKQRYSFRL